MSVIIDIKLIVNLYILNSVTDYDYSNNINIYVADISSRKPKKKITLIKIKCVDKYRLTYVY